MEDKAAHKSQIESPFDLNFFKKHLSSPSLILFNGTMCSFTQKHSLAS